MLIDKADQNNEFSFNVRSAMEEMIEQRRSAIELGKGHMDKHDEQNVPHAEYVIQCLNKFIRYNNKLQTLNLSNTGLNGQVLAGITQGLRHAKSLLCIHLTSNPGLSDKIEALYRERLSVIPYEEKVNIAIEVENISAITQKEFMSMGQFDQKQLKKKAKMDQEWKVDEVCSYLNNKRLKPLLTR